MQESHRVYFAARVVFIGNESIVEFMEDGIDKTKTIGSRWLCRLLIAFVFQYNEQLLGG